MRYVKIIANLVLPSILFYGIYRIAGILPAVLLSLGINLILLSIDIIKKRPIANTQILGILGGVFSRAGCLGRREREVDFRSRAAPEYYHDRLFYPPDNPEKERFEIYL